MTLATGALDAAALRAKYAEERAKRLRPDGNGQYVAIEDAFAHYADDPWVTSGFDRQPVVEDLDVALIGGGFGGLLTGARLRQQGIENFRILEKGGDFGGTWYWNRYPGIACDIESYVYLPLLEEVGYVPRENYSRGAEIFAHCRAIGRTFDLYRGALFRTKVTELRWDEALARWIVSTDRQDVLRARFVVLANGSLQKPKLPGIPGLGSFRGHSFHTSRWDFGYTGGDSDGNLTGLAGKQVGIIGTGASAVQCVPHLAAGAGRLFVFQRTPSSVDVRGLRPTDPAWAAGLAPGWHQQRMDIFQILTCGGMPPEEASGQGFDGWTDVTRALNQAMAAAPDRPMTPDEMAAARELADFAKMEAIRARVAAEVKDPATAEALKPWYRQFCKRPCFHDEYLRSFNRPSVTLVDTEGKGVERITPAGVVANGIEYKLDCLIFATGFEVGTDYSSRAGFPVIGGDGLTLTAKWQAGVRTLHGLHVNGFPNCFVMITPQTGFSVSISYTENQTSQHLAHLIRTALSRGLTRLEATAEAEAAWVDAVLANAAALVGGTDCTPSYYNNEGQPTTGAAQNAPYAAGPLAFNELLEKWRAAGDMKGLACR